MDRKKAEAAIEAILFAVGESVGLEKIANAIELDTETTKEIIDEMKKRYQDLNRNAGEK